MYVYGQLIRAAVETLGADPSTAADKFTGRLWYNTVTDLLKYADETNVVKVLTTSGDIVNADINASAAIAYSKLNLSGAILNADINASAAIAYSKLNLSGAILNADINASAAIAVSKLAALTASRAVVTDGSGFISAATTTATEIGYVNGVTSAIQTQINAISGTSISNLTQNLGLAATVAANAMTIALKQADGSTNPAAGTGAVKVGTRSSTLTSGAFNVQSVTGALSVVISSGSTLGSVSGNANWVYVYAIDNAGTIELAVSGTKFVDEGTLYTTTAEGGAGAADSKYVIYSTSARSNVAIRLIGRVKSTQATAGTWATSPSEISVTPFENRSTRDEVIVDSGNGHGSTNTKIRRFTNIRKNVGSISYADSAGNGGSFTIAEEGIYTVNYNDSRGAGAPYIAITVNDSALTTNASTPLTYAQGARVVAGGASGATFLVSWTGELVKGDIVRAHDNGDSDATSEHCMFSIVRVSQ